MSFKRILPLFVAISTIVLMGVDRVDPESIISGGGGGGFSCSGLKGCSSQEDEEQQESSTETGITGSASYVFRRGEIGATYTTGTSTSKNYKSSNQLGHALSEGITLSDQYKTYHPMSRKILNKPPKLRLEPDEAVPEN